MEPKEKETSEDPAGQGFFEVLVAAGIVNWDELAEGMERSVEEAA